MIEHDSETPRVYLLLQIHYDERFIPVAHSFVESLAAAKGITPESTQRLWLLVEESLAFIMDKFIDSRIEAHIELLFTLEDTIPDFHFEDSSSASGLWYKLVQEIADDFSFINNHKDGWLIRIEKYVDRDASQTALPDEDVAASKPSLAKHIVRPATPAAAAQLIDLAYHTYRYSYATDFYNRGNLEQAIERGAQEITVLDNGGSIVGAYVVCHTETPESGAPWAEMGGAIVLPEHRTTRAARDDTSPH